MAESEILVKLIMGLSDCESEYDADHSLDEVDRAPPPLTNIDDDLLLQIDGKIGGEDFVDKKLVTLKIQQFTLSPIFNRNWCVSEKSPEFAKRVLPNNDTAVLKFVLPEDKAVDAVVVLETHSFFASYEAEFPLFVEGKQKTILKAVNSPNYKADLKYTVEIENRPRQSLKKKAKMAIKAANIQNSMTTKQFVKKYRTSVSSSSSSLSSEELEKEKLGLFTNYRQVRSNVLEFLNETSVVSIYSFITAVKEVSRLYTKVTEVEKQAQPGYQELLKIPAYDTLDFAKYAKAAYFAEPRQNNDAEITHQICNMLNKKPKDLIMTQVSEGNNIGFILVKHNPDTLVLAFKGTSTVTEVAHDLNFTYIEAYFGSFYTHKGFCNYIQLWESKHMETVKRKMHGYSNLVITGHSLGGSVAQLCYTYIKEKVLFQRKSVSCVAFSPAPTVDMNYAQNANCEIVSWVYGDDVVPQSSLGSAAFLKLCVDEFNRGRKNMSLLPHCRKIRENSDKTVCCLYHPGTVYHLIKRENGYWAKTFGLHDLTEIKLFPDSLKDHKLINFLDVSVAAA
ncbi:hypothetical protein ECANGB1_1144 [Enterospora canceri]|uniref:sn-1-specific diacylglycerol lipase n=1 Tax=Enterospora canceri TaxID=1081671 RepID=A0A1Y1S7G5_9MICR|nr:hypothetical protein ECANGB1_1144 [Enterospora canceri]